MTRAADRLSDVRYELKRINKEINRAFRINSEVTRWAEVADAHRRRAETWRALADLTEDPVCRQAMQLAVASDLITARIAGDRAAEAVAAR